MSANDLAVYITAAGGIGLALLGFLPRFGVTTQVQRAFGAVAITLLVVGFIALAMTARPCSDSRAD